MDKEPLFIYIQALSVALFGNTVFALRIVSALAGITTVLFEYYLTRKLFGQTAAFVAALGLSVSYWHVSMSRLSFRAIMVPLLATIVFYLFWKGFHALPPLALTQGKRSGLFFALAGAVLGLSLYTYLSARFIPIVLVVFLLWVAVFYRKALRQLAGKFSLLVLLSAVVFAPLGIYFLNDREAFFGRPSQVLASGFGDGILTTLSVLLGGLIKAFGAFFVQGDLEWRHNIAGRPAMDAVTQVLLLVGLAVAVRRFRRPESAFVLMALVIMLLPSSLTTDNPHYLRAMGALSAVYALVGVGAMWIWEKLPMTGISRASYGRPAMLATVGALWLFLGPATTWNDYFNVWARNSKTLEHTEAGITEAAWYLNSLPPDARVLVSTIYYPHSDILYLIKAPRPIDWFDGNEGILIGQSGDAQSDKRMEQALKPLDRDTYYVLTGPSERASSLLKAVYPNGKLVSAKSSESGYPLLTSFFVQSGTVGTPQHPSQQLSLGLGQDLELLGYDRKGIQIKEARATASAGDKIEISLYWQAKGKATKNDFAFFAHLVDASGKRWGQSDVVGYPSYQWSDGSLGMNWFDITVPSDVPAGKYSVTIGMYSRSDMKRIGMLDASGQSIGDTLSLFPIKVDSKDARIVQASQSADYLLGGKIRLTGYGAGKDGNVSLGDLSTGPGDILPIRFVWRTETPMADDFTVFLQLLDASGRVVTQEDGQPVRGNFPTSYWDKGETVQDDREILLPQDLPPGRYTLITGMYLLSTGERLEVDNGGDSVTLGTVVVK